jgi:hypothetical protein
MIGAVSDNGWVINFKIPCLLATLGLVMFAYSGLYNSFAPLQNKKL